jgi:hypothetical protein
MRRIITSAIAIASLAIATTPAAASSPAAETIEVRLVDTHVFGLPVSEIDLAPGSTPGTNWTSVDIWHARNIPVSERMIATDGGADVGTLERSVNFNWDLSALANGEIVSQAWCGFTMSFHDPDLGSLSGTCQGSLISGSIVGNGTGAVMRGIYRLDPAGVPGVGPYTLDLEIQER